MDITYKIEFLSDWHCGSGLSAGADVDVLCIKDEYGLPFVPGKTLKGLLKEASLIIFGEKNNFTKKCFGYATERKSVDVAETESGECYFSNAELSLNVKKNLVQHNEKKAVLFRKLSSTAIDKDGIAIEHSLRKIEVTVPLTVYAKVADIPDKESKIKLQQCMKYIKRLGTNRNRGLGRCVILEVK